MKEIKDLYRAIARVHTRAGLGEVHIEEDWSYDEWCKNQCPGGVMGIHKCTPNPPGYDYDGPWPNGACEECRKCNDFYERMYGKYCGLEQSPTSDTAYGYTEMEKKLKKDGVCKGCEDKHDRKLCLRRLANEIKNSCWMYQEHLGFHNLCSGSCGECDGSIQTHSDGPAIKVDKGVKYDQIST